jgi:branched-subunit amino acid aminotransferase/4-amino-4-deoxychorismate lyase
MDLVYHNGVRDPHALISKIPYLGIGVFDTFCVHTASGSSHVKGFSYHLERFLASARMLECSAPDAEEIRAIVSDATRERPNGLAVARLISFPEEWYFALSPWAPSFPSEGVVLVPYVGRRQFPDLKSCSSLVSVMARRAAQRQGGHEALLIDDLEVREGAWSNFFWIDRDGVVRTPRGRVLPGVTRRLVLECSPEIVQEECRVEDLVDRMVAGFITQATHGVVPIREIRGIGVFRDHEEVNRMAARYRAIPAERVSV